MSATRDFISLTQAGRLLEVGDATVRAYAARGLIGVQRLPDLPQRYRRADVLALRDRCTFPARADAVAPSMAGEMATV